MTGVGAGMTGEGAGMTEVIGGNDGDRVPQ